MVSVEAQTLGLAHARAVVQIKRESLRTKDGALTRGVRTFVTSLSVEQIGDGRALLRHIRAHWGVENRNHWKRDAHWREDHPRLRTPRVARLLALLRGALLPLIPGSAPECFATCSRRPLKAIQYLNRKTRR